MAYASTRLALQFGDQNPGVEVLNWEDYTYDSDFITPCDAFVMKVGDKSVTQEMRKFMQGGQQVKLFVQFLDAEGNVTSQNPIFTGFLDKIDQNTDRGGTFFTLYGRNILGQLCDSGIDPWSSTYKFVEGQSLGDVMGKVFTTFGIQNLYLSDFKNRDIVTGKSKTSSKLTKTTHTVTTTTDILSDDGPKTTNSTETYFQWTDPSNTFDLSAKTIKKLQPLHNETFMQFVERNLARFSLHCWAMADGSGVVIGQPDYTQEPIFKIVNNLNGDGNNIISGRIELNFGNQPSLIIAKGFHGGGGFANTRIKTCKVNEYIGYPIENDQGVTVGLINNNGTFTPRPEVDKIIKQFKGLKPIDPNQDLATNYAQYFTPPAVPRVLFWEDEKSRTLHQLENAVRRKMAEFQMRALKLHYTVQDHVQNGLVWKHNTIVTVNDETLGILNQPFWISALSFKKSRGRGTTTDLTLIPVGTLVFGPP